VKFNDNLLLVLAAVALALAIVQEVHPIGFRIQPGVMIVVALLLTLRWALRRQRQKRADILKDVPRRPLGLSDE
jgi:hypothetical protein